MGEDSDPRRWVLVALGLLLLLITALNLVLILRLSMALPEVCPPVSERRSLPCEAIPVKFVLENPECADKLLRAMNVSNVRILPGGSPPTTLPERTESCSEGSADPQAGDSSAQTVPR